MNIKMHHHHFIACALIALSATALAPAAAAVDKTPNQLRTEFRELAFGMFIHFNMATYAGEQWVTGYRSPADFDPGVETIDTDAWAEAAVSAGMKYAVLTVKHVAGFCLWDSQYTTYDVMHPDCPYQKDLVAQFVESFTQRGLKVGFHYHWRHPGFGDPAKHKALPPECDPATHSLAEQIEFQKKQIAELLEKYPECFYFWNDAYDPGIGPADELMAFERGVRPNLLMASNWWDWGKKGERYLDIGVKELRHFPAGHNEISETCWKLENKGWFWNEGARAGSAKAHIKHMEKAAARNSNYLLNVGPDKEGRIIDSSLEALRQIGELRASGRNAQE